VNHNQFNTAS